MKHSYKQYVELLDDPSKEPTESPFITYAPSSSLQSYGGENNKNIFDNNSVQYIIFISFITNIITLCCLFGMKKCMRQLREYVKYKYLTWNLSVLSFSSSSSSSSSSTTIDNNSSSSNYNESDHDCGIMFDDIYT